MRRILLLLTVGCGASSPNVDASGDTSPSDSAIPDASSVDSANDARVDGGTERCIGSTDGALLLPGDDNGVFDPSVAFDPRTSRLWMSYSSVDGAAGEGRISTWLAFSEDGGDTWCGAQRINAAEDVPDASLPTPLAGSDSFWSHEVSSLAFDPQAPEGQRWRLVWHRYLHADDGDAATDDRRFEYGWIAQRTAPTPEALYEAAESKLFAAAGYRADLAFNNSVIGEPEVFVDALNPALSMCLVMTEPAMVAESEGLLYMAACGSRSGVRIVSLRLNAGAWSFIGEQLRPEDAQAINAALTGFNAADLHRHGDQTRLLISPVMGGLYRGCILYNVVDGVVSGAPIEATRPHTDGTIQSGVCAFDPALRAGMIFGETHFGEPQFRLFATGIIPGG
ncbi:MAG: hypothetical protein AAF411_03170 [Myxococcota bacterium]